MTEMLKGIAASDGVAVAKAYLLVQPDLSFETITVEDTNAEEARLDAALKASQDELSVIREKAVGTLGEEAAQPNQGNNPCEESECRSRSERSYRYVYHYL